MVSSQTLRRFVKMHETKLQAKLHGQQTSRVDAELAEIHGQVANSSPVGRASDTHWNSSYGAYGASHRPKSRYFDFILTSERH